jgi:hypothetical protein
VLTSPSSSATLKAEFTHGPFRGSSASSLETNQSSRTPSPSAGCDLHASHGSRGAGAIRQRSRSSSGSHTYHLGTPAWKEQQLHSHTDFSQLLRPA